MAKIHVPVFESLDQLADWLQSPGVREHIRENSQVVPGLCSHPNIAPLIRRYLEKLQDSHIPYASTPESILQVLAGFTPEERASAETIPFTESPHSEKTEKAYTAELISTDSMQSGEKASFAFTSLDTEGGLFADIYRVTARVGEGGMGAVYLAYDTNLDIKVALKILKSEEFASEREVERFLGEARSAARLNHPNIVRVYNAGVDRRGRHYIAMQYIEGTNLEKYLAGMKKKKSLHSADRELVRIFLAVAKGLAYAHAAGIVHRDIKPANILLGRDGTPCLADFGLAKRLDARTTGSRTASYAVMGTPWYMNPEQASGRTSVATPASDIFSFGATMYHLFTGRAPFKGGSAYEVMKNIMEEMPPLPRTLRPGLPRDIDAMIMKCLHKDPRQRYADAGELAADLEAYLEGHPVKARPVSSLERFLWQLRRRKALVAGLLVAVVAAFVIGIVVWSQREAREAEKKEFNSILQRQKEAREARQKEKHAEAAGLLAGAEESFEGGDFEKALELVSSSLAIVPDNPEAQGLKSLCDTRLEEKKRREEAHKKAEAILKKLALAATIDQKLGILDEAVSADPTWLSPYVEKGILLKSTSRDNEALAAFTLALEVAQKNSDTEGQAAVSFHLGQIYWDMEDFKLAQECFEKVLELMPDVHNPMTMQAQAVKAYQEARYDDCIRLLEEAVKLKPDFAYAYNVLGWSYRLKGDYKNALPNFEKALEFKPEDAYSYINRGIARNGTGDNAGAIEDYTKAIEIAKAADNRKAMTAAYSNRGAAFKWKGELDRALEDLDRSLELDAQNASGYHNRAVVRCALGNLDGALEDHDRAIKLRPGEASYYNGRGATRRTKKDYQGAIEDYLKAIRIDPKYVEPYYNLGYAHYALGENRSAIEYWKKAIAIQQNLWQAWNALGVLYKSQGKFKEAIEAFGNVVKIMPDHVTGRENLAQLLWTEKRYQEAAEHYEQLAMMARNPSKWYTAAIALTKAGEKQRAVKALEAAIGLDGSGQVRAHAKTNSEFDPLRNMPEFQRLFAE